MSSTLAPNPTLIELGPGAQIAMHGFRASAFGQTKCGCLQKFFNHTFGSQQGVATLRLMMELARCLGYKGQRKLKIASPSCVRFTQDEASLLSALSAAQDDDPDQARAHLTWLFVRPPREYEETLVFDLVEYFSIQGLEINTPENGAQLSTTSAGTSIDKVTAFPAPTQVGHA
ncbi:MAG: hypothetical protein ABNH53_14445 [Henriciella sp.]|jgi:hypothetical protein